MNQSYHVNFRWLISLPGLIILVKMEDWLDNIWHFVLLKWSHGDPHALERSSNSLLTHLFLFLLEFFCVCFFFAIYKNISITELTPMNEGALSTKVWKSAATQHSEASNQNITLPPTGVLTATAPEEASGADGHCERGLHLHKQLQTQQTPILWIEWEEACQTWEARYTLIYSIF